MTFLLDVNVLIALIDPAHVGHDIAHQWFEDEGRASWATCPITENGVIRILGNPRYPNSPGSPAIVASIMQTLKALPGHIFWPDRISLTDGRYTDFGQVLTVQQVTDSYLLALAVAQGGQLATLDRRISTAATLAGRKAVRIIGVAGA